MINRKLAVRLVVIAFFFALNIVLGARFLKEARLRLPEPVVALLSKYGLVTQDTHIETIKTPAQYQDELDPRELAHLLNVERIKRGLPELTWSPELAAAAQVLLEEAAAYNYDFDAYPADNSLGPIVADAGYEYLWVSQSTLVGPFTKEGVVQAWQSKDSLNEALSPSPSALSQKSPNPQLPEDIGYAVIVTDVPEFGMAGVVVQLLATPKSSTAAQAASQEKTTTIVTTPSMPEISDAEVEAALNTYRAAHGHEPLTQAPELCAYAEKRAADLQAVGGLDGHAGFEADFAGDTFPPQLASYPGTQIGENLAFQYCRNMSTGESFVAINGTELIEWCFDSSTKGHREAQLSTVYKHACVKHADHNYVVIFGN